jgi:dTDP-4-amino-4,6-dideoxygalactose transaminase
MTALSSIASRHALAIVEDACQAHGATCAGRPVGTFGSAGAFSFYPTKNLGALGDGGAIVTNNAALADKLKRLRNGGQTDRYHHPELGVNSRLDDLQAAVLRARLPRLAAGNARRRELAARYRSALAGGPVAVPAECDAGHVYHLFVVLARDRAAFQAHLQSQGIGTLVHYPIPVPRQAAFAAYAPAACPIADRICAEVCSLPMHPQLSDADAREVVAAVTSFRGARGVEASGRVP